jgi:hypothetical protein
LSRNYLKELKRERKRLGQMREGQRRREEGKEGGRERGKERERRNLRKESMMSVCLKVLRRLQTSTGLLLMAPVPCFPDTCVKENQRPF